MYFPIKYNQTWTKGSNIIKKEFNNKLVHNKKISKNQLRQLWVCLCTVSIDWFSLYKRWKKLSASVFDGET